MFNTRATMMAETRKGLGFKKWHKDPKLQTYFVQVLDYLNKACIQDGERFDEDQNTQKDLKDSEKDTGKKPEGLKDDRLGGTEQVQSDSESLIAARQAWLKIIKDRKSVV